MARKRHAAITYNWCDAHFRTKLKSRNYKRIFVDCNMYDRGDHFEITLNQFKEWERTSSGYKKHTEEVALATVSKDNVLTMTFEGVPSITECNRLTSLTGWPVGLNKRRFGNHMQHVRVYCKDSGWEKSEPYFTGMQWDVTNGGAVLLNPQPDLKLVVDNTMVQTVRKQFDPLRKLTRTMLRLGAYDDFARKYMENRWKIRLDEHKSLDQIDPNNPIGDDAMALVAFGCYNIDRPNHHVFDEAARQYVKIEPDVRMRTWLTKAMERGLKELRYTAYKKNDGYVKVAA